VAEGLLVDWWVDGGGGGSRQRYSCCRPSSTKAAAHAKEDWSPIPPVMPLVHRAIVADQREEIKMKLRDGEQRKNLSSV
jgi:hypothetical protein